MKLTIAHGLFWNYISLVILAITGIAINIVIASYYGSQTLGIFNQVYAIYILTSQFAVGGIHFSTLKHIAEAPKSTERNAQIIYTALLLAIGLGILVSIILYFMATPISQILQSKEVALGIILVAPALLFFSINKVILSAVNGLHWMRLFAFGQATRYLLLFSFIVFVITFDLDKKWLTAAFLFSEMGLFVLILPAIIYHFKLTTTSINKTWIKTHISFGIKGFFSGVFIEINSRVDVLMLGFFTTDTIVGIYSFAAILAEGFYQIFVVVRNSLNPQLVYLLAHKQISHLQKLVRKTHKIMYPSMLLIALITLACFLPALEYLPNGKEFLDSFKVLAVLVGGFWLISAYVPFDMIFTQAGLPGYQSLLNAFGLSMNLILNALFIPAYGATGAATATVLSFISTIFFLNLMVRYKLGYTLR
ncbi:MAG: oligosaccharide flippase family protein [Gammaproteobacteria bacterium]|nr:oligosaccharide flippase family protein [Gammaproteobacteria bacterium]